jgi:hypothetical protein
VLGIGCEELLKKLALFLRCKGLAASEVLRLAVALFEQSSTL